MAAMQKLAESAAELSEQGKFVEAADKLDEILKLNEGIAEVHLNKGVALTSAGELPRALEAFERAAKLKPELAGAHANLGNVLKRMERHEDAVKAFRAAVDQDPSMLSAWSNMLHELNAMGKFEEALKVADECLAATDETHIPTHNERIFALFNLNRADDAMDDVEAILEKEPMEKLGQDQRELYSLILSQKGSRLLSKGDAENAEAYLERACEGDPSAGNMFPYGVCLVHLGKDEEAVPVLEKAASLDPDNWRIPVALGTVHMRNKRFDEAITMFERALRSDEPKKDSTVNFNYAVALMNAGREDEARAPLELVVSLEPDNHVALGLLGTLYIMDKDYLGAVEVLDRAVKLPGADKDSSLQYNLGYAKLMSDKPDEAVENFEEALRINPSSEQAAAAVKALKPATLEKADMDKPASKSVVEEAVQMAKQRGSMVGRSRVEVERAIADARTPLERVQAMLSPQRPPFLRRKSMEGITLGYVTALATVYDEITEENLQPSY